MKDKIIIPLIIVGVLFMMLGAALGINSILVPYLKTAFELTSASSYLIVTATFSAFIIFGYPSGLIISLIGYKKSIVASFILFSIGLYLFIPSGRNESFTLFLIASFIMGMGNTLLQAAINPYITILGPTETAAKRMCIMTICNRAGWAIAPIFLSIFLDITSIEIKLNDLILPFYILTAIFIFMGIFTWFVPLPEIKAKGEDENDKSEDSLLVQEFVSTKKSILDFPHLILGVIALFCYVGIDTLCLVSIVDFAQSANLPNPEIYTSYTVIGISSGCLLGIFLVPRVISQLTGLRVGVLASILFSILIPVLNAKYSIYFIPLISFATCLTWGAVWPLAISNLGRFTKEGSSLLVMSIVGGALFPLLFGLLKDLSGDIQFAYWIFTPALIYIAYYSFWGYKVGLSSNLCKLNY